MNHSRSPSSNAHSNSSLQGAAEREDEETFAGRMCPPTASGGTQIGTSVTTGAWSTVEDGRLREAVALHGNRWSLVATYVETRSGEQCAKRWNDYVNPDLDHSPWSAHEDDSLLSLVGLYGHNWKLMSENFLPSRSALAIKNRHSLLMRRQRREARQIEKQQQHRIGGSTGSSNPSNQNEPSRCPFDLIAVESSNVSTSSSASSPFSVHDRMQDRASMPSIPGRSTGTNANFPPNNSFPANRSTRTLHAITDNSDPLSLDIASSLQYGLEAGPGIGLSQMEKDRVPEDDWYGLGAYNGSHIEDLLGGPDQNMQRDEIALSTPSSLGREQSLRSAGDQDMEFSVTCSKSKLKSLVCHAFEGAMLEMDGSAEGEPVTVTLRLKR